MDRFAASLDNFTLECETIDDSIEKAIARYELPFRDGAVTDDLGQKARTVRLRCYWYGATYVVHYEFLDHLKKRALFELSHPQYGLMAGRVESITVRHDDREECAEVDLAFVQDLTSQEEARVYVAVTAAVEAAFVAAQQELQAVVAADCRAALGPEAGAILATPLDPDLGIVAHFPGVSLPARAWLAGVEATVATWEANLLDVANPATSLIATIDYATDLPGRVVGALARSVERVARLRDALSSAPARFLDSLALGLTELRAASGERAGFVRCAGAARLALEAAVLYQIDETARDQLRRAENTPAFDTLGRYRAPEPSAPVLDVRELERSLALVRTEIQAAIAVDRAQPALKRAAAALLDHVNVIKLERDRIVRLTLDQPLPLHLVCLHAGLSYRYAERLLALNRPAHPNFMSGEVDVYVR